MFSDTERRISRQVQTTCGDAFAAMYICCYSSKHTSAFVKSTPSGTPKGDNPSVSCSLLRISSFLFPFCVGTLRPWALLVARSLFRRLPVCLLLLRPMILLVPLSLLSNLLPLGRRGLRLTVGVRRVSLWFLLLLDLCCLLPLPLPLYYPRDGGVIGLTCSFGGCVAGCFLGCL